MKLNWRKVIFVVICAELLFIYWNSISAISLHKQQTRPPISSPDVTPTITQVKPATLREPTNNELNQTMQKAS
ncbi:hypothetical protein [Paenibacillus aestuarii]|uniref:Uncharacterized protein n=1 Tax=Paenibacillus aestuarii TaxID=516965 RepID=A0ABW0KGQ7_9BACL|nr:hypothetical protein [Paenibacillus aestuarii]